MRECVHDLIIDICFFTMVLPFTLRLVYFETCFFHFTHISHLSVRQMCWRKRERDAYRFGIQQLD